jgi:hypothetical protein
VIMATNKITKDGRIVQEQMLAMFEWASEVSEAGCLAQDREPRGDKEGGRAAGYARRD